jgi:hypothetical protein
MFDDNMHAMLECAVWTQAIEAVHVVHACAVLGTRARHALVHVYTRVAHTLTAYHPYLSLTPVASGYSVPPARRCRRVVVQ